MAATHKETKQFYTLYNTLDDTKLYLEKEVCVLTWCYFIPILQFGINQDFRQRARWGIDPHKIFSMGRGWGGGEGGGVGWGDIQKMPFTFFLASI